MLIESFFILLMLLDTDSAAILSDGDEFCDDSILQDLRRRRALYFNLLKQLGDEIHRSGQGDV